MKIIANWIKEISKMVKVIKRLDKLKTNRIRKILEINNFNNIDNSNNITTVNKFSINTLEYDINHIGDYPYININNDINSPSNTTNTSNFTKRR